MAVRFLFVFVSIFLTNCLLAQNRSVTGTITDQQSGKPLNGASVQLRNLSDSSMLRTLSDAKGNFLFSNLKSDSFQLSVSFIGFNPVSRSFRLDSTDISIDIAATTGSAPDLETVVIRTAISPVAQKGDTLQINASQYKVNPDASGEDLIKKVPGVTIENGQVKAQGENVQKVTIDGRELFGDDATAALRNLPAEIIDKIQIFDRLSDQAQFSGFDDGNTSKSINIVTKANMRNGQFGRVFAGYGTDNRYSAGGNTTFLKENRRLSLVGNFNNINQQNFSQQDLLGVTSNAQRGGGGGGNRGQGGGGRPQGGGGNRGQGGNQGGGGNFGNNGNFLVGQQNGINKTNAFGFNYSDVWSPKITVTGSYLFNNTRNSTNETANLQYINPNSEISNISDTTKSSSRNNNHRFNLRFEYKIDSNNQIIITPNLSFQDNRSQRQVSSLTDYFPNDSIQSSINRNATNSTRAGNNLNNSILYRHSFAKRGRTFSINLNTSTNKRTGESFVNTFSRSYYANPLSYEDTSSNRFSDQSSSGFQTSANLSYTEPLSVNSQLQFSYNPSYSKSKSDQQTYMMNPADNKYSVFLSNLSNVFESRTIAHNGGISYRYGNRDRQISFGLNYQHTNLNSERILPFQTTVDKSFNNFLPNAQVRYKISTRSSLRFNYRANVNQPSVTQLQDVLDINNAPVYTLGNPDLNQQYMHTLSTQYTFTNTGKGLLFVGNIFYQAAQNYIASASFNSNRDTVISGEKLPGGYRLTKPVNLDGYNSLRSFMTFAIPLKFIKSNFNLNGGIVFSKLPGLTNNTKNITRSTTYTLGAVIASNVSQYVDFTVSYSANFNKLKYSQQTNANSNYFQHVAGVQLNLLSKNGWFFQNDLNNQYYSGLSAGFNQSYFLWNMSAGKKFLKDRKGELKLGVFDLLKQNRSISRNITSEYIEDVQNQVLTQYFMLTFTYNLRNFGTAAARAANRANANNGNLRF